MVDGAVEAEGVGGGREVSGDGVDDYAGAAGARHNAVAAVAAVDVEARYGGWTEEGFVVGGVSVLAGLEEPVGGVALPDVPPEGADAGHAVGACRVEQLEREASAGRHLLQGRAWGHAWG